MKHETADGITPSFVVIHCLSKIQLGRISFLIERLPLNVHGKMSKVYYSNHSLGLSYMLRVWTIYALFTCLTIRLCNVHESHHTKHRRENYMPKNEDYKNRLGSVRIEPQACVLYLWQERSSYRNVEACVTIPNSTLADSKLPTPKNNTFLYCHIRFYTSNSKSTFLETALSHSPFVYTLFPNSHVRNYIQWSSVSVVTYHITSCKPHKDMS